MMEFAGAPISPEEQEALIEEEARGKIRDFVHDPHLKFHFSRTSKIADILNEGIVSKAFAERIGRPKEEDYGYIDKEKQYNSVSVVDRDKNKPDHEHNDWWVKKFSQRLSEDYDYGGAGYTGFLLPSNLAVRDYNIQPNESHAPIRINPKKIEGLFVVDNPRLFGRVGCNFEEYDDQTQQRIITNFDENSLGNNFELIGFSYPEIDGASKVLGIPADDIRPIDILTYFAKKARVPLYAVNKEFSTQQVIWPEVKQVAPTIETANSIDELYQAINALGGIYGRPKEDGSRDYFAAQNLIQIIEQVRSGGRTINHITRSEGLREKVRQLLESKNEQN